MESGGARTEEIMTETQDSDAQRAGPEQEQSQQVKATVEFFREKYADDDESEPVWIDPKGDSEDGDREERS
jgi:hypothetical protein